MIIEKNRRDHDPLEHSNSPKLLEIFSHLTAQNLYTNHRKGSDELQRLILVGALVKVGRHGGDVVAQPGVAADVES